MQLHSNFIFFVNGTWAGTFAAQTQMAVAQTLFGTALPGRHQNILIPGNPHNTHQSRQHFVKQLVNSVLAHWQPGCNLALVGHSHGGNIALLAADLLHRHYQIKANHLLTIATPVRADYCPNPQAYDRHWQVYNHLDVVQPLGGHWLSVPQGVQWHKGKGYRLNFEGAKINRSGEFGPAKKTFAPPAHNICVGYYFKKNIYSLHNYQNHYWLYLPVIERALRRVPCLNQCGP